jgi:4-alpha-glucanotransferase
MPIIRKASMARTASPDYLHREAGILLHPTSLPGRHGIGDLSVEARRFVDLLVAGGQRLWQILPLNPIGHGNSPYSARSALAGNPLLISLDTLADEGLLSSRDIEDSGFPSDRVDYDAVEGFKMPLLRKAHRRFRESASASQLSPFERFCRDNSSWLEDYALFMALKESNGAGLWLDWEEDLVTRRPEALERKREELAEQVDFRRFAQFQFYSHWDALKRYANAHGVRIVGDIPIFVALDSADVWARPDLFYLDERRNPTVVAGVPPDYFSKTGQRWGNPLYRWDVMAHHGYDWWAERFRLTLRQVDLVRIDHFRGFEAYWEVPAEYETAERGEWVEGPGRVFFDALESSLGTLPVIAEDLGTITPEVEELRLGLGFPGMKVLQFAFGGGSDNPYLPHNYERDYVVYTGTHDNDTTIGWFRSRPAEERRSVLRYLDTGEDEIHWKLIRLAYSSVAAAAVVPLQDVLGLDSDGRMNMPGEAEGNWEWRVTRDQLDLAPFERLRRLAELYGRLGHDGATR